MALSVIDRVPLRVPPVAGLNVTLIVQLAPAATLEPHVSVSEKSPEFAPVIPMLEILSAPVPVLLRVTLWGLVVVPTSLFPNVTFAGKSPTAGAVPVPERATVCGLPKALSATDSDALLAPVVAGVNVTLIAQLLPAAKLAPQLLVSEKSVAFAPVMPMPEIFSGPVPVLLSVIVLALLAVPTN